MDLANIRQFIMKTKANFWFLKNKCNCNCCPSTKCKLKNMRYYTRYLLQSLTNHHLKLWRVLAISVCIIVCTYQVGNQIHHYLKIPTVTSVSIKVVGPRSFPPVTLCRNRFFEKFTRIFEEKIQSYCGSELKCNGSGNGTLINLEDMHLNLFDIWNEVSINQRFITTSMSCETCRNVTQTQINIYEFNTYFGKCLSYIPGSDVKYDGSNYFWQFSLLDSFVNSLEDQYNDETAVLRYNIKKEQPVHDYELYFSSGEILRNLKTNIRIDTRLFKLKNTRHNPCYSWKTTQICKNQCYQNKINKHAKCRLPFMNRDKPNCTTYSAVKDSFQTVQEIYQNTQSSDCDCGKACDRVSISTASDVIPLYERLENSTIFKFYFSDGMQEIITESYLYNFSALLSDVAGNLGFFLGISVLSCLDSLVHLISKLCQLKPKSSKINKIYAI